MSSTAFLCGFLRLFAGILLFHQVALGGMAKADAEEQKATSQCFDSAEALADDDVPRAISCVKDQLGWNSLEGIAREWWETFESQNPDKSRLILALLLEIRQREATIYEFFVAYVYSDSEDIVSNLEFLAKMKDEQRRDARLHERLGRLDATREGPGVCSQETELNEALAGAGWGATAGDARRWWLEFQSKECHSGRYVLEILNFLREIGSSIGQLFVVYGTHPDNTMADALALLPLTNPAL